MNRLLTVAEMTLRELLRRRGVLALMLLLPLTFYLIRRDAYVGQSVRSLMLGISWAVSTAALFATGAARELEPRLRLAGYRPHHLYLGRMLGLWAAGLAIALPFFLIVVFDAPGLRHGGVAAAMLCCVAIAPPLGILIGALLPRELEGTLLLLVIVTVQMLIDPAGTGAKLTPFWSSREIGTWAVDHTDDGYLTRGVAHGLVVTVGMIIAVAAVSSIRLRRRRHLRHLPVG
ncbi:ABC transporter permease [Micromonospora okii]|uniref:ABC transporter permease n=1 Tax=Micromonospora okii TaxID=1182970 RepID=UPI001E4C62B9|nr:ABC transporter permease [Micromonospora okii]